MEKNGVFSNFLSSSMGNHLIMCDIFVSSGWLGNKFDSRLSVTLWDVKAFVAVGAPPSFLLVNWGVKYDFKPHVNLLFYGRQIRVKAQNSVYLRAIYWSLFQTKIRWTPISWACGDWTYGGEDMFIVIICHDKKVVFAEITDHRLWSSRLWIRPQGSSRRLLVFGDWSDSPRSGLSYNHTPKIWKYSWSPLCLQRDNQAKNSWASFTCPKPMRLLNILDFFDGFRTNSVWQFKILI